MSRWCKQRDGDNCLYCGKPLGKKYILEHLKNDRNDNRLENFALAHQHCNITKAYNTDYELIAQAKLEENEQALFIPTEDKTSEEASTEIKIAKTNFEIQEQYLLEKTLTDGFIFWHDALYGATYKCRKLTGYGSVQCTRNNLYTLTSHDELWPYRVLNVNEYLMMTPVIRVTFHVVEEKRIFVRVNLKKAKPALELVDRINLYCDLFL